MSKDIRPSQGRPAYVIHVQTKSGKEWISPHDSLEDAIAELESLIGEWGYEAFDTLHFCSVPVSEPNTAEADSSGTKAFSLADLADEIGLTVADTERVLHGLRRVGLVDRIG